MTLLFGQHPTGSMVDRQYPLHARVGSVGDFVPPPTPEPETTVFHGGGGWGRRQYIRRKEISESPPIIDDDLIAALTAFALLETTL